MKYLDWQSPIWKRREHAATKDAVKRQYIACVDIIVDCADMQDDFYTADGERKSDALPTPHEIRDWIEVALQERADTERRDSPISEEVKRLVRQELCHEFIVRHQCDVWAAHAERINAPKWF